MIKRGNVSGDILRPEVKFQIFESFAGLFAGMGFMEIGSEISKRYFDAGADPISLRSIGLTACLSLFAVATHEGARDIEADIKNS